MNNEKLLANALRILAIDAVEEARSGHPGMPMGMADIATSLWINFLQHNPCNPTWQNRDRFILSNGHGSMLLYGLLHLTGYDLPLEELKNFRQLHSRTPGHPEYGLTPGVEATTGPLGQGLAMACGMALSEKLLAAEFNKNNYNIVDHNTYCFVGDGCLMEGISHEAASFAGTYGLGKLIVFWDDNGISIDGATSGWTRDDVENRFKSYNWQVLDNVDGHDQKHITTAIKDALSDTKRPSLICCRTTIGHGSPNYSGKAKCHGAPLGAAEIKEIRKYLDWQWDETLYIPDDIYAKWDTKTKGAELELLWQDRFAEYKSKYPTEAKQFQQRINKELDPNNANIFTDLIESALNSENNIATRAASQKVLESICPVYEELLGGSADLSESNLTLHKNSMTVIPDNVKGNYIHYGVREFGMSAIANGIALHGGHIPYVGTFLVFADYAKAAIRLSSLMQQRVIYVFTHDSIALGEDGPTHQPVEHLAMLRMTPGLSLWRPADMLETTIAWQQAVLNSGPTCICLTRQKIPSLNQDKSLVTDIAKGCYVAYENSRPQLVLIATGSEVSLSIEVAKHLAGKVAIRVVSMPSCDKFLAQEKSYQEKVLPGNIPRMAVEAGANGYWYRFVTSSEYIIGLDRFGESAPGNSVYNYLGFSVDNISKTILQNFT